MLTNNRVTRNKESFDAPLGDVLRALDMKDADVSAGDFLGLVGSSGRSTEPHLHIHAAFGSVIYGPMRRILFREAQFLGKHHAIMPIGESPWIDANGKEIPAMRSLIWPSSEARTGWPRDWPEDTDERERGPDRPWEWPIRVVRSVVRFFSRLFQSMFGSGR
jgi:hypothetical protein